jgi:eukaryotic-like serine/threonine-protein kinase
MLRFYTLGAFELLDGEPPSVRLMPIQSKRLALLAYLALALPRGFHRRDTLLALFWPELSGDEARRALRQALHHLRRAAGEGVIETRPDDQVRLRDGALWCDALAFEDASAAGRPGEALALYRNAFLAGVHVPEVSVELEQWIEHTRERLHQAAGRAAAALSLKAEQDGDLGRAVEAARAAHDLHPDDESCARRLMQLHERRGDRPQALQVYERLVRRLADEYQTKPSAETAALARVLREVQAVEPLAKPSAAAAPAAEPPPPSPSPPPAVPRGRWAAIAVGAVVLFAAAVLVVRAWQPRSPTLLSTGRLAPRDRVIVADFESHDRDSLLADAVTAALRLELSQSPVIKVLSAAAAQAARRRMQDPAPQAPLGDSLARLIAVREGLRLVVQGGIAGVGREWIISTQIVDAPTGEPLASVRETAADSSHLFEAIDRVARGLRERIGESTRVLRSAPPLRQITTSSLQALQRWSAAHTALDVDGDRPKGRRLLEEATALDTSFAMAWRALSGLYGSLGPPEAMVDAATRAHRYRDRLTDRERHLVDAEYHMVVTQDFAKAFAAYDSQLVVTPDDPGLLGATAYLHFRLREFDESERLYRHAMAADSSVTPIYFGLMESRINQGRQAPARMVLGAFRARFPDNRFDEWEEIYLAAAAGAYDSAEVHARRLLAAAPDDADHRGEAIRTLANLALLRGRLAESTRLRRQAMSVYEANGDMAGYWLEVATLATGEIRLARRPDAARRIVADALRRHPLDSLPPGARPYVQLGILYAGLGDLDRAAEMQAALERLGLARGRFAEAQWRRLRGSILLARRRYLEAQAELRLAAEREECTLCSLPALARSYDLAGQADSAAAVYERYLRTPWMKRLELDATELGAVCLRLGELYQERSDQETAAVMYRRVATLWRGADGELGRAAAGAAGQGRAE